MAGGTKRTDRLDLEKIEIREPAADRRKRKLNFIVPQRNCSSISRFIGLAETIAAVDDCECAVELRREFYHLMLVVVWIDIGDKFFGRIFVLASLDREVRLPDIFETRRAFEDRPGFRVS